MCRILTTSLSATRRQSSATTLFVDVRQSSDITQVFRLQTAAKMMKAYFDGGVRIVNANDGYVRSFNGDGMLALFATPTVAITQSRQPCR